MTTEKQTFAVGDRVEQMCVTCGEERGHIVASVTKTGRCAIVHEATRTSGFGAELSALVQENCFYSLEAPIVRVTGWDTPYPHSLEWEYFPGPRRVAEGLRRAMEG